MAEQAKQCYFRLMAEKQKPPALTEEEKAEARRKGLAIIDGRPYDPDDYVLDAMHYGITHSKEIHEAFKAREDARANMSCILICGVVPREI
jgi:hypothetical protein